MALRWEKIEIWAKPDVDFSPTLRIFIAQNVSVLPTLNVLT